MGLSNIEGLENLTTLMINSNYQKSFQKRPKIYKGNWMIIKEKSK